MAIDLQKGLQEVQTKSEREIELESAQNWLDKSAAAYYLVVHTEDLGNKIAWLMTAEDLKHEFYEHAALADDTGEILRVLKEELAPYRQAAVQNILGVINQVQPKVAPPEPQA